jgi:hypothetical protein
MVNPSATTVSSIDINLKNLTVTSNSIEIPINVDTKGEDVSAIQFELAYDASKLKFETIATDVPTEWYTFTAPSEGRVKFGALDQKLVKTIKGSLVPFKVNFTALQSGIDINSFVKVTQAIDAADKKGNQLGINLNTETIKLTGYNNF